MNRQDNFNDYFIIVIIIDCDADTILTTHADIFIATSVVADLAVQIIFPVLGESEKKNDKVPVYIIYANKRSCY